MTRPKFADGWYDTPPVGQLRQEVQAIYAELAELADEWPSLAPDGSAAEPSFAFASNPGSGLFSDGAGGVGIASGGEEKVLVGPTKTKVGHTVQLGVETNHTDAQLEFLDVSGDPLSYIKQYQNLEDYVLEIAQPQADASGSISLASGAASTRRILSVTASAGSPVYFDGSASQDVWHEGSLPYAAGSFTPTFTCVTTAPSSVTYSAQQGRYARIGRIVVFSLELQTSAITGGSGTVRINGLPFTAQGTTPHYPASLEHANITYPSGDDGLVALVVAGTTQVQLQGLNSGSGTPGSVVISQWKANGGRVRISGTYLTADL